MRHWYRLLVVLIVGVSLSHCKQPAVEVPQLTLPTRDDNMALGNPDGAVANWSSWHLSSAWKGSAARYTTDWKEILTVQ